MALAGGAVGLGAYALVGESRASKAAQPSYIDDPNYQSQTNVPSNSILSWYGVDNLWRAWAVNGYYWYKHMKLDSGDGSIPSEIEVYQPDKPWIVNKLTTFPNAYYHLTHGCYWSVADAETNQTCWDSPSLEECNETTLRPSDIELALPASPAKKGKIAFIGSCNAMDYLDEAYSDRERQFGNLVKTFAKCYDVVVGYCNITSDFADEWNRFSIPWQDFAFHLCSQGYSVGEAFAIATETDGYIGKSASNENYKYNSFTNKNRLYGPCMEGHYKIAGNSSAVLV